MEKEAAKDKGSVYGVPDKHEKDLAALGYIWALGLVLYFAEKDSEYIRFHVKQSIVLFLLSIPLAAMPVIGKWLLLIIVGGEIYGFALAANGRRDDMPVIGQLARGNASPAKIWLDVVGVWRKGKNAAVMTMVTLKEMGMQRKKMDQEREKDILKPPPPSTMLESCHNAIRESC